MKQAINKPVDYINIHDNNIQLNVSSKFTPSQVDATVDGNNLISYSSLLKISWVRQKDLHIISAGPFVYTSDERFEPKHVDHTDEWYLHIKYVQTADTGTYECQISTEPKMSLPFYLNVIGKIHFFYVHFFLVHSFHEST